MTNLFKIILLFNIIFVFNLEKVLSQEWEVECPDKYNDYTWINKFYQAHGEQAFPLIDIEVLNIGGVNGLESAIINGRETFIFDKDYYQSSGGINNRDYYGFLMGAIIRNKTNLSSSCPFTNPNYKEVAFIIETDCKVEKSCYLKLNQTSNVICADQGWTQAEIDQRITTVNGVKYIKVSQTTEVCGTQCCEWVVRVECTDSPAQNGNNLKITSVTKNVLSNTECVANSYEDCLTGQLVICGGSCE